MRFIGNHVESNVSTVKTAVPFNRYEVRITENHREIIEAQKLRYRVFGEEMGASLPSAHLGLDRDRYDYFVKHLIVRDTIERKIIGYTRILTREMANIVGGFYSGTEFDLTRIMALQGNIIEIGRTCIDKDYRRGSTISLLWSGIARAMEQYRADYLIGCASIPMGEYGDVPQAVLARIGEQHRSPEMFRVFPKTPLPFKRDLAESVDVEVPPLIKGYLRVGAKICGEPCWDPEFGVADVFIFLERDKISKRYLNHFVAPAGTRAVELKQAS